MWYPVEERSVRIAVVLASATAAGAFGGCIAYGVGFLNSHSGLEGFRWLFIIEGLITIVSVLLVVFFLPDYPARARWLSDDDKKFIEDRIAVKGGGYPWLRKFFSNSLPRVVVSHTIIVNLVVSHTIIDAEDVYIYYIIALEELDRLLGRR